MSARAVIVGTDALMREGLAALLTARGGLQIVASHAHAREAFATVDISQIDLILFDCAVASIAPLGAALAQIETSFPGCATVLIAAARDARLLIPITRGSRRGCLLREEGYDVLQQALAAVLAGDSYVSPTVAGCREARAVIAASSGGAAAPLSARETEIMHLIACGQRTRDIASRLALSPKTIEKHRSSLMRKLGVHNVAGVAIFAAQQSALPRPAGTLSAGARIFGAEYR